MAALSGGSAGRHGVASGLTPESDGITFPVRMPLATCDRIGPGLASGGPSWRAASVRSLRGRRLGRLLVAFAITVVTSVLLFFSPLAHAADWTPPPLRGHVVDQAGALTSAQALRLDRKLDRARRETGFAIVVYLLPKLPEGMTIEDVGYTAGNAWGVGSKDGDDGVILLASLAERKLRIETGRGVGGALTDIASSHINRDVIGPLMRQGRVYEAMDRGVDAILKELVENTPGGTSQAGRDPSAARKARGQGAHAQPATPADFVKLGVIGLVILGVIILAIVSPTFRELLFLLLLFGRFGGGGGGGGRDSGSGYGGGGGSFGGGGSSDDY